MATAGAGLAFEAPAEILPLKRFESLSDQAFRVIRENIATGILPPGGKLTERGLASTLGVSPTPVREALCRLEHEGLVERVSPRNLRVIDHSVQTVHELMQTEVVLRATEARFATTKIDDDALIRMSELVDRLERGYATNPAETLLAVAHQFDDEIAEAADNPVLRSLISSVSIFGQERRLRSVRLMQIDAAIFESRVRDHRQIVEAFHSRDPDLVENVVRQHLSSVVEFLQHLPES